MASQTDRDIDWAIILITWKKTVPEGKASIHLHITDVYKEGRKTPLILVIFMPNLFISNFKSVV